MVYVDWPSWPAATVPLAHPGLLVANRYRLLNQISVNATGAVWLATDQRLNRHVTLKQVVLEAGLDPRQAAEARQRVLREGRLATQLQHPHVVAIHDVTLHDGEPWLVTEYLRARSLDTLLTLDGPLSDRAAARMGAQLADALDAAHRLGIVHREIRPDNVLVCPDGNVKLADFAMPKTSSEVPVPQTGAPSSTPGYRAPELAQGGPATPASDIFSLGATLYASIEGRPPFALPSDPFGQLGVVANGQIEPPRRADWLAGVLIRLLETDPDRRPSASQARVLLSSAGPRNAEPALSWVPSPRATSPSDTPAMTASHDTALGHDPSETARQPRHWLVYSRWRRRLLGVLAGLVALSAVIAGSTTLTEQGMLTPPAQSPASAPVTIESALTQAIRDYYALLPADPAAAWQRLTPNAQRQLGGAAAFTNYWRNIRSVLLLHASPSVSEHTVRAQVRLQTKDGQIREIAQRLVLLPVPGGDWLINEFGSG